MDYQEYKALLVERRGAVIVGTLNAPPMNPVGPDLHDEIHHFLRAADEDDSVRVIVMTGAGDRAFSAGGDINWMKSDLDIPRRPMWSTGLAAEKSILQTVLNLRKPLITRINGHAMGLGATLAVLSDFSFMVEDAKIADTHVKVGLVAGDGGALLWPLLMGFANARRYLLTGDMLTGKEAAELGLINRCMPDEELDDYVQKLVERLIALPPHAVNYTKASINQVLKQVALPAFETSLAYEIYTMKMDDVQEATNAVVQKRPAKFTGN